MDIELSHLDKIYWPEDRLTKGDLLDYYSQVASVMVFYLKDRPLVMHRFPNGIDGKSFYQKDVKDVPAFVKTATIAHKNRRVCYILAQNAKTLLYVVNLGSIEIHLFSSTIKSLDKPNYLILDLDPESISFDAVVDTALVIHEILLQMKIPHFCKTSGGSGLHVFVPLRCKYEYGEARFFAGVIARLASEKLPKITSMERDPKKRQKKVYIDTLQNAKGQLVAAPYSVRAFPGAPVSTPLSWDEVHHGLDPKHFTLKNVPIRLAQKGDLFKGILGRGATF